MYHKWQSYDVWFLSYWAQQTEFFVILDYFLHFYPPNNPKNQNFEKLKKTPGDITIYTSVPKIMIICHTIPEIWCVTDVIIFHFGLFFAFLPSNSPKNQNFENMKKTPGAMVILHPCTINYDQIIHGSWDMVHDVQTDRRKKCHIEVGAPPKNNLS